MRLLATIPRAKHTFVEERRSSRHRTNCLASVELGDHAQQRTCTIVDMSAGGARIAVTSPTDLPDEFSLVLAFSGGNITRRVHVVWRADGEIGVRYV